MLLTLNPGPLNPELKQLHSFYEKAVTSERERRVLDEILKNIAEDIRSRIIIPQESGLHIVKLLVYRADYIVTVDTGVGHIAHALGKNPIVLYKEMDDYVTSFFGSNYSRNFSG